MSKTKYTKWTNKEITGMGSLKVIFEGGKVCIFEQVKNFVYLGRVLTTKAGIKEQIQIQSLARNRCVYALNPLLKSEVISISLKIMMYIIVVRTIVPFVSEVWKNIMFWKLRNEECFEKSFEETAFMDNEKEEQITI